MGPPCPTSRSHVPGSIPAAHSQPRTPGCHRRIGPRSLCPGCRGSAVPTEGDKPPAWGQGKGTSPSKVPRVGGPVARPRSEGTRVGKREQHPAAWLACGPGVVAAPCPPPRPPDPGWGQQLVAPAVFIFPAAGNISCKNCLLTGGATGQRAAVRAGTLAHAILPVWRVPAGCGTDPVPTHVPLGTAQRVARVPPARCEGAGCERAGACHGTPRDAGTRGGGTCWLMPHYRPDPVPTAGARWPRTPKQLRHIPHAGREVPAGSGLLSPMWGHTAAAAPMHPTPLRVPAPRPAAHATQPLRKSRGWGALQRSDAAASPWQRVTSCLGAQGLGSPEARGCASAPGWRGCRGRVWVQGEGARGGCGCPSAPASLGDPRSRLGTGVQGPCVPPTPSSSPAVTHPRPTKTPGAVPPATSP